MPKLEAVIINPLAQTVPPEWNSFVEKQGLISAWRAEALWQVAHHGTSPFYQVMALYDGQPVAAMVGRINSFGSRFAPAQYIDHQKMRQPGLFYCYLPLSFDSGLAFSQDLSMQEGQAALSCMERALARQLRLVCPGIIYHRITDADLAWFGKRPLQIRLKASPVAAIENRWSSLSEYFADLPTARRKEFEKIERQNRENPDLQIVLGAKSVPANIASKLAEATNGKHQSASSKIPPIAPGYFETLSQREDVFFFNYFNKSGLVAFDLGFVDRQKYLYTPVNGSDQSYATRQSGLYFDLYLREIAFMIENKLHGVRFGPGMFSLKEKFGCRPIAKNAIARPLIG